MCLHLLGLVTADRRTLVFRCAPLEYSRTTSYYVDPHAGLTSIMGRAELILPSQQTCYVTSTHPPEQSTQPLYVGASGSMAMGSTPEGASKKWWSGYPDPDRTSDVSKPSNQAYETPSQTNHSSLRDNPTKTTDRIPGRTSRNRRFCVRASQSKQSI